VGGQFFIVFDLLDGNLFSLDILTRASEICSSSLYAPSLDKVSTVSTFDSTGSSKELKEIEMRINLSKCTSLTSYVTCTH